MKKNSSNIYNISTMYNKETKLSTTIKTFNNMAGQEYSQNKS